MNSTTLCTSWSSPKLQLLSIINRQLHENTKFSTRNAKFCSHLKYFVLCSFLTILILKKVILCFSSLLSLNFFSFFCLFLFVFFCCCCCCLKAHMHRTYIHNGNIPPDPYPTHSQFTWIHMANIVHKRMRTNIYADISMYSSSPLSYVLFTHN